MGLRSEAAFSSSRGAQSGDATCRYDAACYSYTPVSFAFLVKDRPKKESEEFEAEQADPVCCLPLRNLPVEYRGGSWGAACPPKTSEANQPG